VGSDPKFQKPFRRTGVWTGGFFVEVDNVRPDDALGDTPGRLQENINHIQLGAAVNQEL
jgi:hypothetical protein